jgi:hypothetical protein
MTCVDELRNRSSISSLYWWMVAGAGSPQRWSSGLGQNAITGTPPSPASRRSQPIGRHSHHLARLSSFNRHQNRQGWVRFLGKITVLRFLGRRERVTSSPAAKTSARGSTHGLAAATAGDERRSVNRFSSVGDFRERVGARTHLGRLSQPLAKPSALLQHSPERWRWRRARQAESAGLAEGGVANDPQHGCDLRGRVPGFAQARQLGDLRLRPHHARVPLIWVAAAILSCERLATGLYQ